MNYIIAALGFAGIILFTVGATETKPATWESTYMLINTFNGSPIRIKKSSVTAYKYNPKYDYTDVYVGEKLFEIREIPEEIDELLGRKAPDPQAVETDQDAVIIQKIDAIMKDLEPRYKSGELNGSMAMSGLAEAKQYIGRGKK